MLPVSTREFWKHRIDNAKQNGREHYAVYITGDKNWEYIAQMHKIILDRECKGMRVLDAGCGYGRASEWFDADKYRGVDLSPEFIAAAKEKYPDKEFSVSNLNHLPFPANAFDVAFCISIKQMVIGNLGEDAWNEIETELRRVARRIIILEYEEPNKYQVITRLPN